MGRKLTINGRRVNERRQLLPPLRPCRGDRNAYHAHVKGRIRGRSLLGLKLLAGLFAANGALAAVDTCVRVDPPIATNSQVLIRFSGEPDVSYFVERSTNAGDWFIEQTNTAPEVVREALMALPGPDVNSFYRISRQPLPPLDCALMAKEGISLGALTQVDSFNSTNALYSTNGRYDPTKALASGNIYSASGAIVVSNAAVRGVIRLGTSVTNVLYGTALVGDASWAGPGIQPNHVVSNFSRVFPSITAPPAVGLSPSATDQVIGGVLYQYVFNGGGISFPPTTFVVPGFTRPIYVSSNSNVRLLITGDVNLPSNGNNCVIEPGARAEIFMLSTTFNLRQYSIENRNNSPASLIYYGTDANTDIRFGDGCAFNGLVYAPNAVINIRAALPAVQFLDVTGIILGRTISSGKAVNFHADQALFGAPSR